MAHDRLQIVQEFVASAREIHDGPTLRELIADTVVELGFRRFAMVHHVDVIDIQPGIVHMGNYPTDWIALSRLPGVLMADPVIVACQRRVSAFDWRELPTLIPITDGQQRRLNAARRHGLINGVSVPLHVPGEVFASANFACAPGVEPPEGALPVMQTFAQFAFEAARRIIRAQGPHALPTRVPLTTRQHECVVLSAQGKSDWVAAQVLGLSPKTVNRYMEAAKLRYAVATRQQLIVHALFGSEITFAEVLSGDRRQVLPAMA